jgi:hypothetical protein
MNGNSLFHQTNPFCDESPFSFTALLTALQPPHEFDLAVAGRCDRERQISALFRIG